MKFSKIFILVFLVNQFFYFAHADSAKILNPDNGHQYQRFDIQMSWHQAKLFCENKGGHLATITSAQEDNFIYTNLVENSPMGIEMCWLGGTDEATEGTWRWVTGETWNYTNWSPLFGEPNNCSGIEHYLTFFTQHDPLGRGGTWNDLGVLGSKGCGCGGPDETYVVYTICEWEVENCLNVGNLRFCADSITQSGNVYTLTGNVNINGKLWFSKKVIYTKGSSTTGTLFSGGYPYVKLADGNQVIFTATDITYNIKGNAGTLEPISLNFSNYALSLTGIPLGITSNPIAITGSGVLIGGNIVIGSGNLKLCSVDVEVLLKPGDKVYLQNAKLSLGISSNIPGIKTTSIELKYDGDQDELTGSVKLDFPFLGINGIEASISVQPGCIDGFQVSVALKRGITLGTTGLSINGFTLKVDNICTPPKFYIFFGGDLGIVLIPSEVFVLKDMGLGYQQPYRLNIEAGTARFLDFPIAQLSGYLDASGNYQTGAGLYGKVNFNDFYAAEIDLKMLALLKKFIGSGYGTLQIPDFKCDSIVCSIIKAIIKHYISLPYSLANQRMDIYIFYQDGHWKGSIKGMTTLLGKSFAVSLNYSDKKLHFSIGDNYEDMIQVLDNGKLSTISNSAEQSLILPTLREDVIFSAVGNTIQPQIYLKTPNGEEITSGNFGNYNGVSYIESDENLVTLFILDHAAAGNWTFGVSNLSSSECTIKILSRRQLSQTTFTRVNKSGNTVSIEASVNPPGVDTRVSFYYSERASGGTGVPIVENISTSNGTTSTSWDFSNVPTGTYYIFAKTYDNLNAPIITYYTTPLIIDNIGIKPPTDLLGTTTGNTVTLTWKPSTNPAVVGYQVLYTDEPTIGGYKYRKVSFYNDQAVIEDLDPDKVYCFCVKAFNNNGNFSIESNTYCTGQVVPVKISLNRKSLTFGAILNGEPSFSQPIIISSNNGILNWTAVSSDSWLQVSPESGTGDSVLDVHVNPSGLNSDTYTGTITVSDPNASNSPQTVNVTLNVYSPGTSSGPFGEFATPEDGSTVRSSIPVTGWVLDDIGVESVRIFRGEVGDLVYIGDAVFVEGARPDVEQTYPQYPMNFRAGWGYMMLTNFLPGGGNGEFKIHALATDVDGHQISLGTKTITCDNAHAVKPFGAIDTPGQGGTASGGNYRNWGWVLTPQPNIIPTDGTTINVWVDGINLGRPIYDIYRSDVATLFTGYANSNGAAGYFDIDTASYDNGLHTIQWTAEDSGGNKDGIGSRYFIIQNSGNSQVSSINTKRTFKPAYKDLIRIPISYNEPVTLRKGYTDNDLSKNISTDSAGNIHIKCKELERIEIQVSRTSVEVEGYMITDNRLGNLPAGSTLEKKAGRFSWIPGPGFIGTYSLVFIEIDQYGEKRRKNILVTIIPKFSGK
jgi:hypothetical protein